MLPGAKRSLNGSEDDEGESQDGGYGVEDEVGDNGAHAHHVP